MRSPSTESFLTAKVIEGSLGSGSFIKKVFAFESIDSTNTYARNLAAERVGEPTLIVAEEQTHGRGRFRREWHSERGKNLTFSLLVYPKIPADRMSVLPLCVAQCVADVVEVAAGIPVETKWPNDLLIKGKKVCGILLEPVGSGPENNTLITGIGLNVNQKNFPADPEATSLSLAAGKSFDRLQLLGEIVRSLQWLSELIENSLREKMLIDWKVRCGMWGKEVRVQSVNDTLTGIAKGVSDDGALLLDIGGKEHRIFAGDVKVVGTGTS